MNTQQQSVWFWRAATCALGAALFFGAGRAPDQESGGRFQVVTNAASVRDTYLLDSATGATWRIASVASDNGGNPILGWAKVEQVNLRAEADLPRH
jgi:hypothetical protein